MLNNCRIGNRGYHWAILIVPHHLSWPLAYQNTDQTGVTVTISIGKICLQIDRILRSLTLLS